MAISINWSTRVITVPQADLTLVSGTLYELDVDTFRLSLRDIEDGEEGAAFVPTHTHSTAVTLSGVTYARTVEIINGYTITFEDTGSPYTVRMTGANHNLADVTNYTSEVSLIVGNSAGLIVAGSGVTAGDVSDIVEGVWGRAVETLTAEEIMRILLAGIGGKRQGLGTATEEYMAQDGTTPRITLSGFDAEGNGTPALDGS
jgi:hypothetical protein